jgi:hypothetical protein
MHCGQPREANLDKSLSRKTNDLFQKIVKGADIKKRKVNSSMWHTCCGKMVNKWSRPRNEPDGITRMDGTNVYLVVRYRTIVDVRL